MELKNLKDVEKRAIYLARIRKKLFERFRGRSKNTNPLFIAGWQPFMDNEFCLINK